MTIGTENEAIDRSVRDANPHERLLRVLTGITKHVLNLEVMDRPITLDTNFFEIGIDSMSVIDLVLAIEDELKVQFSEQDLSADLFQRAENLVNLIRERQQR